MFGLRLGEPRAFISTTPKPKKLIMDLIKDPSCITTRGTTYDNRSNLAAKFFDFVVKKYEGTRLGEQELMGALLEESEGALWTRTLLDQTRVKSIPKTMANGADFYFKRIVVGVDPAITAKAESDETGIVVAGLGSDDEGYLLADYSGKMSPGQWAKRSVRAFKKWKADAIVAEGNQGGDMVKHTIKGEDKSMPVQIVHASRGKVARAEPIAQRFESGHAHMVGTLPNLEDQMCVWEPLSGDKSPDRLDAAVWALTACILGKGITDSSVLAGFY
jgi:phage terminase large subunit-like protein